GALPAPVLLRRLDFREASRLHPPRRDETRHMPCVEARPAAARTARAEPLQPRVLIHRPLLAVDPAVTERAVEGLRVGDGAPARALLVDAEPNARRLRVIPGQPGVPCLRRCEGEDRILRS